MVISWKEGGGVWQEALKEDRDAAISEVAGAVSVLNG